MSKSNIYKIIISLIPGFIVLLYALGIKVLGIVIIIMALPIIKWLFDLNMVDFGGGTVIPLPTAGGMILEVIVYFLLIFLVVSLFQFIFRHIKE